MSIVVGYTYRAARLCDECARTLGITNAQANGDATMWGDCGGAEDTLSAWARSIGLDRDDEDSFPDSEFPKRITGEQAESAHAAGEDTRCACGWDLRQPF